MRFSLIMCTLGRRDELAAFFESLLRQNRTDFEIIVVDQNDDDRLVDLLARYTARFPLKHIRMNARGASRARNCGIGHVSGELLAFPDDDCEYLDGYLDRLDDLFKSNPDMAAMTSQTTADASLRQTASCLEGSFELDVRSVLNRCQEFTIVVRRRELGAVRFNDFLGVGSGTPWGADEAPDFLIAFMKSGQRSFYYPGLFVYHPNKLAIVTRSTLARATSYARGRGCFLRLHKYPLRVMVQSVFRPLVGSVVYLVLLQPMRSAYYLWVVSGLLRGLLVSRTELARIAGGSNSESDGMGQLEGAIHANA
jgi:glycosyltransferase involved in cell wall biosynthesis